MPFTVLSTIRAATFGAFMLLLPGVAFAEAALLKSTVDLRAGPGQEHRKVARLQEGSKVRVFRCAGRWCSIAFGGDRGWIPGSCLTSQAGADGDSAVAGAGRKPPLVMGPGPVRTPSFNPPDWPGAGCPEL